jgi:Myotubularin-like phosphatase domain
VQKNTKLFYYERESSAGGTPKGFIDLLDEELQVIGDEVFDKSGFGFVLRVPGRDYRLVAETGDQRQYWVRGIRAYQKQVSEQGPLVLDDAAALRTFDVANNSIGAVQLQQKRVPAGPDSGALRPHLVKLRRGSLNAHILPGFGDGGMATANGNGGDDVDESGGQGLSVEPMPGECMQWSIKGVVHEVNGVSTEGALCLSNYRLIFVPASPNEDGVEVPLMCVRKSRRTFASNQPHKVKTSDRRVSLYCSDFRTLRFVFKPHTHGRRLFSEQLAMHSPASLLGVFAFALRAAEERAGARHAVDGWSIYDARREFERFGIGTGALLNWRLTEANVDHALCRSYPELLAVPSALSDAELAEVASFRSRGRVPALTWVHPHTHAALSRCSQPRVGIKRNTCAADERLIQLMSSLNGVLIVADARPRAAAVANTARGAGFESASAYKTIKMKFLNIENIHAMRKAGAALHEHAQLGSSDDGFFSTISTWINHIKLILYGAVKIASFLDTGQSVLIHCSDGMLSETKTTVARRKKKSKRERERERERERN